MCISKKQYLRKSKDLKLSLLCNQKLLILEGPKGSIAYPLCAEFDYSKTEKKLSLTQAFNKERKKAFFQMYQMNYLIYFYLYLLLYSKALLTSFRGY